MAKRLVKSFDIEAGVVTFEVVDGPTLTLNIAKLNADTRTRAMYHGIIQKVGDAAAGDESPTEVAASIGAAIEQLEANNWKAIREAGAPKIGLLVAALARLTGKPEADCQAAIEALDDDTKKKIKADARIKAAMASIRAEREAAKAASAPAVDFSKFL